MAQPRVPAVAARRRDRPLRERGESRGSSSRLPTARSHVTGHAVDIGPVDAQFWLIEHGARYGICQTYANERWHFELATAPGGTCPALLPDAAG